MFKNALLLLILAFLAETHSETLKEKYILYDVNPGEGFNLRRDVFMRVAVMVRKLNLASSDTRFTLVLPPWGHLYHWKSRDLGKQTQIPWGLFFDVESISLFVPAIEFTDYQALLGSNIDVVYYLQGFAGGWKDGKFEEKFQVAKCLQPPEYQKDETGLYEGYFWDFDNVRAVKFDCLSVQGSTRVLQKFLEESQETSVMLDRAESLLHDFFGDVNYWGIRRAMKFSSELAKISNQFRESKLDSSDEKDDTIVKDDWREHRAGRRIRGGPFACVHLRRGDYVRARVGQIPSIKGAADQLDVKMKEYDLGTLYVATDASNTEFEEFRSYLKQYKVLKYNPTRDVKTKYMDGGIAILDQLICSHAKYFIGSYESTFSFRIQEEREIMGFPLKTTFDMLCPDGRKQCEKGSQWKIDWGTRDQDWSLSAPVQHAEL